MPASRAYRPRDFEEHLEITVEGDLEPRRSVYFTDQSPVFKFCIKNTGDKKIEASTIARLSYSESDEAYENEGNQRLEIELDPGENVNIEHKIDMLSYQGSTVISIDKMHLKERENKIEQIHKSNARFRLYTFMVYDREYYKFNYLYPRRAQYMSALLAVFIVLVGVIQLGIGLI